MSSSTPPADRFARGYLRRAAEGTIVTVPGGYFIKTPDGVVFVEARS